MMTKKGKMNNGKVKLFVDPELSHLALSNCECTFSLLHRLLFIIFSPFIYLALDPPSLNLIPQICRNLISLSLNGCGKLTNDNLNLVSRIPS